MFLFLFAETKMKRIIFLMVFVSSIIYCQENYSLLSSSDKIEFIYQQTKQSIKADDNETFQYISKDDLYRTEDNIKGDLRREFDLFKDHTNQIFNWSIFILLALFGGIYGLYFRINHKLNQLLSKQLIENE